MFVAYMIPTSGFGGTASAKSPRLTVGVHTLIDGMLINAYKLIAYFIDNETG